MRGKHDSISDIGSRRLRLVVIISKWKLGDLFNPVEKSALVMDEVVKDVD